MNQPVELNGHHPDLGPDTRPDAIKDMGLPVFPQVLMPVDVPALVTGKAPGPLEELEFLKYSVLVERAQKFQLLIKVRNAELHEVMAAGAANSEALGAVLSELGEKYGVDFHVSRIDGNGQIVNGPTVPNP